MNSSEEFFIWTEVFNCGKIGRIAVETFLRFHDLPIHVFGTSKDLTWMPKHKNVRSCKLPFHTSTRGLLFRIIAKAFFQFEKFGSFISEPSVLQSFRNGHLGTAKLWAFLIETRPERFLIHFDSDVIFRKNVVDQIIEKGKTHDLVGPIRNYKNNPNNRDDVRHLPDVTQTVCFGFNREKIGKYTFPELVEMCRGSFNPRKHPVIDFFDPVMFDILGNGGTVFHLHYDSVGGCNGKGTRRNKYSEINDYPTPFKIDFGDSLIHFSAVGSGMNIFHGKEVNIPVSYKQYALDRYAFYCKVYYDEDLGFDLSQYSELISILKADYSKV